MQQKSKEKIIIVAVFLPKIDLKWYVDFVDYKFDIKQESLFLYEIEGNNLDYLMTFKLNTNKRVNLRDYFNNATVINIKKGCLFSINGMNKLIEKKSSCDIGNVNYKAFKIDWHEYRDKLVLANNEGLSIKNIKKININNNKII